MRELKRIFAYLTPYKGRVAANIGFNILGAFFSLFSIGMLVPFLGVLFGTLPSVSEQPAWSLSVDALTQHLYYYITVAIGHYGQSNTLMLIIAFVLLMALLKNAFTYLALYHLAPIRAGVVQDMRNTLFAKILTLPLGYYTEERKGDIVSRMSNDTMEVESSIIRSMEMLFRDPVLILVHLTGLLVISPRLTLFVLILLPVAGGAIGRVGKNLRQHSKHLQQLLGNLLATVDETLQGLRIVKAFNAEKSTYGYFTHVNETFSRLNIRIARRRDLASPLSEFLGTVVIGTVLWYGGSLALPPDASMQPEGLIGFIGLFYMILNPAKSFANAYFNLLKGLASLDRIQEVLSAKNPIQSPEKPTPISSFKESIEFRNVSFSYDEATPVLQGINLSISRGMTVALVGQSGAGKTTLADLIPRFYDVSSGNILIDGVDVRQYGLAELRGLIGNVNQDPILFNDTFFNNIAFGLPGATQEQVEHAARSANAHAFIMETPLGYQTNIGDGGVRLSGGQRQRLSIARAILRNPPILILDEATSSLDTESEKLVQTALETLKENRTSLIIAHRLSTIRNADLICVLRNGQIVEQGTHTELLALEGEYKKLYSLQS